MAIRRCNNFCPPEWTGPWREWHRGHRCHLDPNLHVTTQHWSVTVERNGYQLVTLESNHLSGKELTTEEARVIRMAAEHLLACVGRQPEESLTVGTVDPKQESTEHGRDCPKAPHYGEGYLHNADDDRPYDIDGLWYCGRCHGWMETPILAMKRLKLKGSKMNKQVFRVDAQGDTLYIDAKSREEAEIILRRHMGPIPPPLLTWSGPMPLPEDEEALR